MLNFRTSGLTIAVNLGTEASYDFWLNSTRDTAFKSLFLMVVHVYDGFSRNQPKQNRKWLTEKV